MKLKMLFDWLSFSVKCKGYVDDDTKLIHSSRYSDVQYVVENILMLPFDCFNSIGYGRYGYRDCLSYEGINVYYDGFSLDMGLCVSLSGNSCRVYERYHSMLDLLKRIYDDDEVRATRIDIACDDFDGVLDVSFMIEQCKQRRLRSNIRKLNFNGEINGKKEGADTLYIGSSKSNVRFRIYDKAKEQGDYEGVWNRLEGIFRHEHADSVIASILESDKELGECVSEIINDQIQFINLDDSNITRCSIAQWWLDFIGTVKRLKLALPELPKSSVDRLYNFFDNMSASIYALSEALGEQVWDSLCESGRVKAKPRHRQMILDYKCLAAT